MKSGNKTALLALVLASTIATGCSSSQTGGDGGDAFPLDAGPESSADAVGSIPEDMLADAEGHGEAPSSSADPFNDLSEKPEAHATNDDPFADLQEKGETTAQAGGIDDLLVEGGSSQVSGGSRSSALSGETADYHVKSGDTLMKIAFSIYGDIDRWKDLQDWNRAALTSGTALRKGMTLKYETPAEAFSPEQLAHSYLIKTGDTLAGIADDVYGRREKYKKLQSYNPRLIKNPHRIFAGFTLFYDITQEEMAEAEARRQQKASGGAIHMGDAAVPSAVQPVPADVSKGPASAPVASHPAGVPDLTEEK